MVIKFVLLVCLASVLWASESPAYVSDRFFTLQSTIEDRWDVSGGPDLFALDKKGNLLNGFSWSDVFSPNRTVVITDKAQWIPGQDTTIRTWIAQGNVTFLTFAMPPSRYSLFGYHADDGVKGLNFLEAVEGQVYGSSGDDGAWYTPSNIYPLAQVVEEGGEYSSLLQATTPGGVPQDALALLEYPYIFSRVILGTLDQIDLYPPIEELWGPVLEWIEPRCGNGFCEYNEDPACPDCSPPHINKFVQIYPDVIEGQALYGEGVSLYTVENNATMGLALLNSAAISLEDYFVIELGVSLSSEGVVGVRFAFNAETDRALLWRVDFNGNATTAQFCVESQSELDCLPALSTNLFGISTIRVEVERDLDWMYASCYLKDQYGFAEAPIDVTRPVAEYADGGNIGLRLETSGHELEITDLAYASSSNLQMVLWKECLEPETYASFYESMTGSSSNSTGFSTDDSSVCTRRVLGSENDLIVLGQGSVWEYSAFQSAGQTHIYMNGTHSHVPMNGYPTGAMCTELLPGDRYISAEFMFEPNITSGFASFGVLVMDARGANDPSSQFPYEAVVQLTYPSNYTQVPVQSYHRVEAGVPESEDLAWVPSAEQEWRQLYLARQGDNLRVSWQTTEGGELIESPSTIPLSDSGLEGPLSYCVIFDEMTPSIYGFSLYMRNVEVDIL